MIFGFGMLGNNLSAWSLSQAINYAYKAKLQLKRGSKSATSRRYSYENSVEPIKTTPQTNNRVLWDSTSKTNNLTTILLQMQLPKNLLKLLQLETTHKPRYHSNECPNHRQLQLVEQKLEEDLTGGFPLNIEEFEDVPTNEGEFLPCIFEKVLLAPKQPDINQRYTLQIKAHIWREGM